MGIQLVTWLIGWGGEAGAWSKSLLTKAEALKSESCAREELLRLLRQPGGLAAGACAPPQPFVLHCSPDPTDIFRRLSERESSTPRVFPKRQIRATVPTSTSPTRRSTR